MGPPSQQVRSHTLVLVFVCLRESESSCLWEDCVLRDSEGMRVIELVSVSRVCVCERERVRVWERFCVCDKGRDAKCRCMWSVRDWGFLWMQDIEVWKSVCVCVCDYTEFWIWRSLKEPNNEIGIVKEFQKKSTNEPKNGIVTKRSVCVGTQIQALEQ